MKTHPEIEVLASQQHSRAGHICANAAAGPRTFRRETMGIPLQGCKVLAWFSRRGYKEKAVKIKGLGWFTIRRIQLP